jgi:hypothetical protein
MRSIIDEPVLPPGFRPHVDRPSCYRERDDGHACAAAATPELQQDLMRTTPGCELCARGQRAALLYWRYAR